MRLVLASASPRRAEILRGLGFEIDVRPADVPEDVHPGEAPQRLAERLARKKALAVASVEPGRWVLAGDTVVAEGATILGKPVDAEDAVRMLLALQGRAHGVVSALALAVPEGSDVPTGDVPGGDAPTGASRLLSGTETTTVRFRSFDREEAEAYVRTGEPMDKAGAYAIQGLGATLVTGIDGDYTNVVGLPVPLLVRLLEEAGRPYRIGRRE